MPFWRTYYHLIWATKNREELITPELEPALYQYITNKTLELGGRLFAINGWTEHVHVIATFPPKIAIASGVKNLKGASSHYINEQGLCRTKFVWQRGYGVLTLGETQLHRAIDYVENQKAHHNMQTTNSWLERADIEDDGPEFNGLTKQPIPKTIREDGPVYAINTDRDIFPF